MTDGDPDRHTGRANKNNPLGKILYLGYCSRQAGKRLDSAPSANVVAMTTKIGPPGRLPW